MEEEPSMTEKTTTTIGGISNALWSCILTSCTGSPTEDSCTEQSKASK